MNLKRIKKYNELTKIIDHKEAELDALKEEQYDIFLAPFKTVGISANACYIFRGLLKHREHRYRYSSNLFVRDSSCGMYFSDESMQTHLPRIFKHFKEVEVLVPDKKDPKCWVVNPKLVME